MRKLFTTLKSVVAVAIVASMTLASSCSYDDTAIKNRVDKVEKDLAALTERVTALENKLKSDVEALTELINNKAVVTNLTTDAEGVTTVELSNGKSFKVYPECTVVDTDTDTNTYIGVKADEDGVLYFAVFEMGEFKEWLTIEGEKVPVYDGKCECTPVTDTNDDTYVAPYLNEEDGEYYYAVLDRKADNKFVDWYLVNGEKVAVYDGNDQCECEPVELKFQVNMESGMLEFSVDGGLTWNSTGLSAADAGQQIIAGVTDNGNNTVTFTLAGNSSFSVIKADLIEFDATRTQLYVLPGETKEINFTINTAVADVNVMNQPLGWSAEVALAPAEEEEGDDEVDPGMGILAAGGTELVLKITGPAQEFVDAGFAAKEGDIVVHFNGNNGTCQVGKIAVNLAELKLAVDAEGNITLENTIAYEQTDYFGDKFTDFADFFIGVMDAEAYAQYGDKVFTETWDSWYYEYSANVNYTKRTTGLNNVIELVAYEEGVTEKEVYNFTVDQLARAFDPNYQFEYGKEYIIFVTLNGEMVDYMEHPVVKNAVMATYKKVVVEAAYVDGSATWNDASYTFSLAGYTHFIVGCTPKSMVDGVIAGGNAKSVEEVISLMSRDYILSIGILVKGPVLDQTLKISELTALTDEGYPISLESNTEYYFHIYPANIASEYDLWTLKVEPKDVRVFGTFTTAGLVEGNFEPGITYEVYTMDANTINVHASFNEDVVLCYWNFFDTPVVDPSERALETMQLCQMPEKFEWSDYCEAYMSNPVYPTYLGIVAVNANGEYVYVEKAFEPEPLPEVAINSFEYLGRYYELDDNPDTNGGGFIYLAKCADGKEYKIEVYWAYCNEDGTIKEGTYDYKYNAFDVMYGGFEGFCIESSETYYGSRLIVEADKITLEIANVAAYVYTDNGTVEPEPQPLTAVSAVAGQHELNGNVYSGEILVTFTMSDNSTRGIAFKTGDNNYLTPGTWQGNDWQQPNYITYVYKDGDSQTLSPYITVEVSYANDVYTIAPFETYNYTTGGMEQFPGYTGTIVGLDAPAVEEPGDNTGGEVEDGVIYVNTFVEMATSGSYNTYFHFKDETGDNEVKFVTCHYDGYVVNDWPKTAEYTWKSSPGYIMNNTFSFMNGSLKVNGTTYVNDDVSLDATASVDADGNVTINFTVGGTAYVFKHNKQ